MNFLRRLRNDQAGFALVLALGITVVLSMTVVTVIEATTANSRTAVQSKNRVSAYTLAEAGINNASSILSHVANAYDAHVLHRIGEKMQISQRFAIRRVVEALP